MALKPSAPDIWKRGAISGYRNFTHTFEPDVQELITETGLFLTNQDVKIINNAARPLGLHFTIAPLYAKSNI